MVAAALILALTATSGRLFLASAGDAAVGQELDRIGGVPMLAMVMFGARPAEVAAVQRAAESVASDLVPGLGPPVRTRSGATMDVAAGTRTARVRLAARDGFAGHIQALERAGGDGAWLPDTAASSLGVRAGQTVRLGLPPGVRVRVVGVYRDLATSDQPLDRFWSPLGNVIYTLDRERTTPPGLLLVDPDRFLELTRRLESPGRLEWDFYPESDRLTLPEADRLAAQIQAVQGTTGDPWAEQTGLTRVTTATPITDVVRRAHATLAALTGPVESISLTGRLLALALVAAAAVFAVRRRRGEVSVLIAHGVGGLPIGARSMVEAALPLAAGGALGYLVALGLAGPLDPVPASSRRRRRRPGARWRSPLPPACCCSAWSPGSRCGPRSGRGPAASGRCWPRPGGRCWPWRWRRRPCTSCGPAAAPRSRSRASRPRSTGCWCCSRCWPSPAWPGWPPVPRPACCAAPARR